MVTSTQSPSFLAAPDGGSRCSSSSTSTRMRSPRPSRASQTFAEQSFGPFQSRSLSAGLPSKKSYTCRGFSRTKSGARPGMSGGITMECSSAFESSAQSPPMSTDANAAPSSTSAEGSNAIASIVRPSFRGTSVLLPMRSTHQARFASVSTGIAARSCADSPHAARTRFSPFLNSYTKRESVSRIARRNSPPPKVEDSAAKATYESRGKKSAVTSP